MWKNDKIKLLNKFAVELNLRIGDSGKNEWSFNLLIFCANNIDAVGMDGWVGGWMVKPV